MNLSMTKNKLRWGTIFALILMVMMPFSSARADDGVTLANYPYHPGDLLASIIYSESSEVESADGVELSYDTMMKYPVASDDYKVYGRLDRPGSDDAHTQVGGQLVSQMRTLYEYGWFEPLPQAQDKVLSRIFETVTHIDTADVSAQTARNSLVGAIFGATIFDMSANIITFFEDVVTVFDVPTLMGLTPRTGGQTWLDKIFTDTLNNMGFGANTIKAIQGIVWVFLGMICIIVTLVALTKRKNMAGHQRNAKRWYLRLGVSIMTIFISVQITNAFNSLNSTMANVKDLPGEFNASYIVDSLDFAVYSNFDMQAINSSGNLNDDGSISEDYKPTREHVSNVQNYIAAKKNIVGGDVPENKQAVGLLEEFASGKISTVADYYSGLASLECIKTTSTSNDGSRVQTCVRDPKNISSLGKFDSGIPNNNLYHTENATNTPFFIMKNDNGSGNSASATTSSDSSDKSDENTSNDEKIGGSFSSDADGLNKVNQTKIKMSGQDFTISKSGEYVVKPFDFRNPQSYIYGAVPPGNLSKATREYSNYINDETRSIQWINPETGERVDTTSTDPKSQAIRNNALQIGIYNRFAGLKPQSFSDQSTSFFLQTKRSGEDTVTYKGYYTAPNADGEAKNVGKYGNAFIRYTMPTENVADYYLRIGSLTSVWGISGFMSFCALIILLRAPVFGGMWQSISGFFSGFLAGNFVGLTRHVVFKIALRLSFIFSTAGIYLGVMIGRFVVSDNAFISAMFGVKSAQSGATGWLSLGNGGASLTSLGIIVPLITISALFCLVLCFPAFKFAGVSGKTKRVSFLGAIITAPYMIAETFMEKMEAYGARELNVKPRGTGSVGFLTRKDKKEIKAQEKQEKIDNRSALNNGIRKTAKVGSKLAVGAAITGATGGAGAGLVAGHLSKGIGNKTIRSGVNSMAQKLMDGSIKDKMPGFVGKLGDKGSSLTRGAGSMVAKTADVFMGKTPGETASNFLDVIHRMEENARRQAFKDSPFYEEVREDARPTSDENLPQKEDQTGSSEKTLNDQLDQPVITAPQSTEPLSENEKSDPKTALPIDPDNDLYYADGRLVDGDGVPVSADDLEAHLNPDSNVPIDYDIDGNPIFPEDGDIQAVIDEENLRASELDDVEATLNPDSNIPVDFDADGNPIFADESDARTVLDSDKVNAVMDGDEVNAVVDGEDLGDKPIEANIDNGAEISGDRSADLNPVTTELQSDNVQVQNVDSMDADQIQSESLGEVHSEVANAQGDVDIAQSVGQPDEPLEVKTSSVSPAERLASLAGAKVVADTVTSDNALISADNAQSQDVPLMAQFDPESLGQREPSVIERESVIRENSPSQNASPVEAFINPDSKVAIDDSSAVQAQVREPIQTQMNQPTGVQSSNDISDKLLDRLNRITPTGVSENHIHNDYSQVANDFNSVTNDSSFLTQNDNSRVENLIQNSHTTENHSFDQSHHETIERISEKLNPQSSSVSDKTENPLVQKPSIGNHLQDDRKLDLSDKTIGRLNNILGKK